MMAASAVVIAACSAPETFGSVDGVVVNGGDDSITIGVGQSTLLDVAIETTGDVDDAVEWSSAPASIAEVDADGRVTGVAEGEATITATSVHDASMRDTIQVIVDDEASEGGDPTTDDPATDDPTTDDPGTDDPTTDDPTTDDPSTDDPSTDDPTTDDPTTGDPTTDDPATDDPTTDEPGTDDPTTDEPVAPTALSASVTSASEFTVDWAAEAGTSYDLVAVSSLDAPSDAGTTLASGATPGDAVPLPPSDTPFVRLVAGGDVVGEGAIANFVYDAGDYDVYVASDVDHSETPVPGTLRYVLEEAASGATVAVADDIATIELHGVELAGGDDAHLMLDRDVTLYGNGATLQGVSAYESGDPGDPFTYNSRMIHVAPDVSAVVEDVTITGGTFIYHGAGVMNEGDLTLVNSAVTGNRAWHSGGGITAVAGSTTSLVDVTVSGNEAYVLPGEIGVDYPIRDGSGSTDAVTDGGWGGGIYVRDGAVVTVEGGSFAGNTAKVGGGGVFLEPTADVSLDGVDVADNVAAEDVDPGDFTNFGGGVFAGGSLAYTGGTVSGNVTQGAGGGLYVGESASVLLSGVTFQDNAAEYGGGIYHVENATGDNLTPDDPVASPEVVFAGGNTASGNSASADYGLETYSGLRMGLRADELPGRPMEPLQGRKIY